MNTCFAVVEKKAGQAVDEGGWEESRAMMRWIRGTSSSQRLLYKVAMMPSRKGIPAIQDICLEEDECRRLHPYGRRIEMTVRATEACVARLSVKRKEVLMCTDAVNDVEYHHLPKHFGAPRLDGNNFSLCGEFLAGLCYHRRSAQRAPALPPHPTIKFAENKSNKASIE
jgi:hypothetical protein